jgi:hypothetical protein
MALVTVFAPTLLTGRVVSVNDTVLDEVPWRTVHPSVEVMNPELKAPATTFVSQIALLRRNGLEAAVWNPYVASGQPGLAAWSNGLRSPTVLPAVALPEAHLLNGILLAKLTLAFVGMLLLLRGRNLDTDACAVGAVAFALSGPLIAQWLSPSSSTAVALPLLLWTIDRARTVTRWSRRTALAALGWGLLATGGDAGATIVGMVVAVAWWLALLLAEPERRALTRRSLSSQAVALAVVGLAILPALRLDSGLGSSARAVETGLGADVARLAVDPFAFGDPRQLTFEPPSGWSGLLHSDTCLAPGWVALALAAVGLVVARRERLMWVGAAGSVVLVLAWTPLIRLVTGLPGTPGPGALTPVFALAIAALAAYGAARLQPLAPPPLRWPSLLVLAGAIVLQQGTTAIHLLPYLPEATSAPVPTTGLRWLQENADSPTDRIVPLFSTLWPDLPQRFGLADVRGHDPEPSYRRWLQTIDSQAWGHWGSTVVLNGATTDLHHPYLRALGGRFVLEPPDLQVVAYSLGNATIETEPRTARVGPLRGSDTLVQQLELPEGCSRIALHAARSRSPARGTVQVTLTDMDAGATLGAWSVDATALSTQGIVWIDLAQAPDPAHRCLLSLSFDAVSGSLTALATPDDALAGSLLWNDRTVAGDLGLSFDVSGFARVYRGADLRIWENRKALPRAWLVRNVVPGNLDTVLGADPPFKLAEVAVVPPEVASRVDGWLQPPRGPDAVQATHQPPGWTIHASVSSDAILCTSIRAAPGLWRMTVDGVETSPFPVNGLFVGAYLEAGEHTVSLHPELPRAWWLPSILAIGVLLGIAAAGLVPARREVKGTPS